MLNYLSILIVVGILLWVGGVNQPAFSQWNAFDAMVNRSQDSITTNRQPCTTSSGDDLTQDTIDWQEDKDGYHAQVPVRVPEDADRKQLKARIMDGVLELDLPKKRLKSII